MNYWYETFSAAGAELTFHGRNVHPGTAKTKWSMPQLAIDFIISYQQKNALSWQMAIKVLTISNHDRYCWAKKHLISSVIETESLKIVKPSKRLPIKWIKLMVRHELIWYSKINTIICVRLLKRYDASVELAKGAEELTLQLLNPFVVVDGSKISFMGIPTPNLFAGAKIAHGRYEFVSCRQWKSQMLFLNCQ